MIPVIQDGQRVIYGIGQDISHLKQSGRLMVKRN